MPRVRGTGQSWVSHLLSWRSRPPAPPPHSRAVLRIRLGWRGELFCDLNEIAKAFH